MDTKNDFYKKYIFYCRHLGIFLSIVVRSHFLFLQVHHRTRRLSFGGRFLFYKIHHKENLKDKHFENEYSRELAVYKVAAIEVLKHYKKLPNTKEILKELNELNEEKSKLMAEYTAIKSDIDKLFTLQKNYKTFKQNDLER